MGLTLPPKIAGFFDKYRDRVRLIAATMSALTATTAALVTFLTGAGGIDQLNAEDAIRWNGPVGLLDADYQHLIAVGKIREASNLDQYEVGETKDPMVAPSGAFRSQPVKTGSSAPPPPKRLPNMRLSGIIWDSENPIAIIDGLDLRKGDKIKGARIVEIRADSVVLSYASKNHVLTLE